MQRQRTSGGHRTLLIASTGGHLEQLIRFRPRLDPPVDEADWVTFDDPQSRSLLRGETVHWVPYVAPRSPGRVLRNVRQARQILTQGRYDRVVTTGSAVVLSFLPVARAMGLECHFIESAARAEGPSVSARLAAHIPGVHMYSQYPSWASDGWPFRGAIFDAFEAVPDPSMTSKLASRVVVTFGTMRTYGFRRAAEALARLLPEVTAEGAEILWQVGATDMTGIDVPWVEKVPNSEMRAAIEAADLVVAHAGVGSALTALDLRKAPVLLVRSRVHHEMVDDHQRMIAQELGRRGLAVPARPETLTANDLRRAMSICVQAPTERAPFRLES